MLEKLHFHPLKISEIQVVIRNQPKNGLKRQVEQGFSSVFAKDFFKVWKIIKSAKNLAKTVKKPC